MLPELELSEVNVLSIDPWIRCPNCGAPVQIEPRQFEAFFTGAQISCPSCNHANDWWKTCLREISDNFMFNQAFGLVSAKSIIFHLLLRPGERTIYRLANYGIPPDAKVLYVNYTPSGPLFPVEIHGNVATATTPRHEVALWPVPLGRDHAPSETKVSVFVTWVPHSQLDDSWRNIVSAFQAYVANDYAAAVVPANVAVESSLSVTLNSYLPQYVGKERTKAFLKDAATYSHQLNVILPLLVGLLNLPSLPENIRGLLNSLRGLRNDIAHLGAPEKPIGKEQCAELLCAALFGFQYVQLLRKKLVPET